MIGEFSVAGWIDRSVRKLLALGFVSKTAGVRAARRQKRHYEKYNHITVRWSIVIRHHPHVHDEYLKTVGQHNNGRR